MPRRLASVARGLWPTVVLRVRGCRHAVVTCEGRAPLLVLGGDVHIGRLAVGGRLCRAEIGAARGGSLDVGDGVYVNQGTSIVATDRITIGAFTRIADFVAVYDTDFHPVSPGDGVRTSPTTLGRNVWLGRNVTVLAGSVIGDNTVVAAGSTVRGTLPANVVAAGNPAVPLRSFEAPPGWRRR